MWRRMEEHGGNDVSKERSGEQFYTSYDLLLVLLEC